MTTSRKGKSFKSAIPKLYYTIGEVSQLTGVEPHTLRFWELQFKELNPRKNRGGKRLYRESDIKVVQTIKELLYTRKFTIEGARQWLKSQSKTFDEQSIPSLDDRMKTLIADIKKGLLEIKDILSSKNFK
ncbi:MAG: MerR family transcriptional regulator [bacterium]